jgi:hypothetical protein
MKYWYKHIIIICFILATSTEHVFSQSTEKKTTRIQVEYVRSYDNTEKLIAVLRIKEERYVPLTNAVVEFYNLNDSNRVLMGKSQTDEKGESPFFINGDHDLFKDSTGQVSFEVEYRGSDTIKGSTRKIKIKQASLEVSFFQKDTVKYIQIDANRFDSNDQIFPLEDQKVQFYIKGMFSLLNIGKEKTDSNGVIIVAFPIDMPGDTSGVLTIVAKVVEDKTYGTIESRGRINWGIPVPPKAEKHRGLGDTDAPLWMVYTLIILLSAVWFHYLYVIYLIVKIKLARKSYQMSE